MVGLFETITHVGLEKTGIDASEVGVGAPMRRCRFARLIRSPAGAELHTIVVGTPDSHR